MRVLPFLTIVFPLVVLLPGCSHETVEEVVRPVLAMEVRRGSELSGRQWPGEAAAVEQVVLSFRVGGPLVARPVKVGDRVKEGDILARIDPADFEVAVLRAEGDLGRAKARLSAMRAGARPEEVLQLKADVSRAQAALDEARATFQRSEELLQRRTISREEYDVRLRDLRRNEAELTIAQEALRIGEAGAREEDIQSKEAEITMLQASLADARNRLAYTMLVAPFDGEVAALFVENFQNVQAKQPVVRLLDLSKMEMVVNIPDSLISYVPYVKDIKVRFEALGAENNTVDAQIKEVGAEASRTTRTFPVTLVMSQPEGSRRILAGMAGVATGRVEMPDDLTSGTYIVPESAVFEEDGQARVWVIDRGTMTVGTRDVALEGLAPQGIAIRGVEPGQWIATAGAHTLRDGQKVRILGEPGKEDAP